MHYSTGIGSDHSAEAIKVKASACVKVCKGVTTVPSVIKVGSVFHFKTNCVSS